MADQQIRDRSGRLMATIKPYGSKLEIRDDHGRLLGTYDPKSNETRDPSGHLVAKGNVLSSLIPPFKLAGGAVGVENWA